MQPPVPPGPVVQNLLTPRNGKRQHPFGNSAASSYMPLLEVMVSTPFGACIALLSLVSLNGVAV